MTAVPGRPDDAGLSTKEIRLLTIDDVAALTQIPVATLRYWRHLGTGPRSFKVGRHVRYRVRDVESWLNNLLPGGTTASQGRSGADLFWTDPGRRWEDQS